MFPVKIGVRGGRSRTRTGVHFLLLCPRRAGGVRRGPVAGADPAGEFSDRDGLAGPPGAGGAQNVKFTKFSGKVGISLNFIKFTEIG